MLKETLLIDGESFETITFLTGFVCFDRCLVPTGAGRLEAPMQRTSVW